MAEEKNVPVPEEKKQEAAAPESELAAELEQVKSRNKILKIVAAVLAALFLVLAAGAFIAYRKIAQAKDELVNAFQNYQPSPQPEGLPMPGAAPSVAQSTMMASTLGLISGSIPGDQPEAAKLEEAGKIVNAMGKYADRPVIKEFIADLKKDPEIAKALAESKGNNPMAVLASIQKAKGANALIAKYAVRPDFIKVMMEAMKDPDMKPVMSRVPMGGGMPQPVPVATGPAEEPQQEEGGSLTLDPSAMNVPAGATPAEAAPARARKVPPPVDTQ